MKKLFTIALLSVFAITGIQAQNYVESAFAKKLIQSKSLQFNNTHKKLGTASSTSRASVESFALDYFSSDNFNSDVTFQNWSSYIWNVNSRYSNKDNFTLGFGAVFFDSLLINLYNQSGTQVSTSYVPLASATLTLDSFDVFFNQKYNTSNVDTLKVRVFNLASAVFAGTGAAGVLNTTSVWDTMLVVNAAFPLLPGSSNIGALTFKPNVTFPTGQTFGVRVDYAGDTANQFNLLAGYKESCNDSAGGNPSVVPDNSIYYINYTQGTTNISGINNLGFNRPTCREFYIQNFAINAYVTTPLNFISPITASTKVGCPGVISSLSTFPVGSDSLSNATFAWSVVPPSAGTLDDPAAADPTLTFGTQSGRVVLTVTDNNGNTTTSSDSFTVRAINIAISPSTITLPCGGTVTIPCTISGYTVGAESYAWSSGPVLSTPTLSGVTAPGTYTVTVTNSAGCTATTSAVVQYPGGLSNSVNFTLPTNGSKPYLCLNDQYTFINTTARTTGWVPLWTFQGGNTSNLLDGVNAFSSIGNIGVTLTMDSANCKFSSTKTVTIRNCAGINDLTFGQSISIVPNPTTGNVMIEMSTVENNVSIAIYNILGAEVRNYSEEANGSLVKSLNLSDLANGAYIVKVKNGNKVATKRLVISK